MATVDLRPCGDARLPSRLAAEADRAVEQMAALVLAEIPHYYTLSGEQFQDVRDTLRQGFTAAMALWQAGRLARRDELARFRANGATRAAEGRPLAVILRAYRLGTIAGFEHVTRGAGSELSAEELANFTRLLLGFIDQLSDEVTLGYVEVSEQLSAQQGRARRELFEDLIAGRFGSASAIGERAKFLGLSIPATSSIIVAAPRESHGQTLAERGQAFRDDLLRSSEQERALALISRGKIVLIAARSTSGSLEQALDDAGLHAVVVNADNVGAIPDAYACAIEIIELISNGSLPFRPLVTDGEARLLSQLVRSSNAAGSRAYEGILGPLLQLQHHDLIDTLDAYLVSGNASAAAHELGIHPQTLRYRLRRIRELTGHDPSDGWHRFLLELALRSHKLSHD